MLYINGFSSFKKFVQNFYTVKSLVAAHKASEMVLSWENNNITPWILHSAECRSGGDST